MLKANCTETNIHMLYIKQSIEKQYVQHDDVFLRHSSTLNYTKVGGSHSNSKYQHEITCRPEIQNNLMNNNEPVTYFLTSVQNVFRVLILLHAVCDLKVTCQSAVIPVLLKSKM